MSGRENTALETMTLLAPVTDDVRARLLRYADQLHVWQKTMNLIAPSTEAQVWERHLLDSWQIIPHLAIRPGRSVVDFGSGAGFPGMVLAMAGIDSVHLIESNQRKAGFLRHVAGQTGTSVSVECQRIEDKSLRKLAPAGVITARACAPLGRLFVWAYPLVDNQTQLLFLKGRLWQEEVEAAAEDWRFQHTVHPSITDPNAVILNISNLEPQAHHDAK